MWITLKRWFFKKVLRKTPATMEMVKYWKNSGAVQAKVTKQDGAIVMHMDGEKYTFPGFPRGHLLYGTLSKLKHELKNQVFNESWYLLEEGKDINAHVHNKLENIYDLLDTMRIELVPEKRMCPPVRELYRAWTEVAPEMWKLRDVVCFILQEDDAYRFRFQWMLSYMPYWAMQFGNVSHSLKTGFWWMEHGEMIDDMKERVRLVKRVLLALVKDEGTRRIYHKIFSEMNWKKVKMTKADKYFFRAKYFKVDLDKFDY